MALGRILFEAMRLQHLPAIRDAGQALAPTVLALGLPWLQTHSPVSLKVGALAVALFCLGFATHALRHLQAFHEDRILGREVLAIAIGSRATRLVAGLAVLLALGCSLLAH